MGAGKKVGLVDKGKEEGDEVRLNIGNQPT
jgi:hypothetical protein